MTLDVANKLVKLRKKNGFSQEELAERLGVSRQAISKWERAEASPDTDNLIALARLYDISLDQLLELGANSSIPVSQPVREKGISLKKKANTSEAIREYYPEATPAQEAYPNPVQEIYPKSKPVAQSAPFKEPEPASFDANKYQTNTQTQYVQPVQPASSTSMDSDDTEYNFDGIDYKALYKFPYPVLVTIVYLMLGSFVNLWHPAWMLFLTIPMYYTAIPAIQKRDARIFAFPVLVTMVYLILGFLFGAWHPMWMLFLSIPFYYTCLPSKKKYKGKKKK